MEAKYILGLVGIIGITVIETTALIQGLDGAYLSAAVGAIAALIGGICGFKIGSSGSNGNQNLQPYTPAGKTLK